ncbi:MAG: hypothetical protein OXU66_07790 [Gammaproteobacteria bacterium]|nr:hypothetical protein [Gammaproteobacteria bacterium]
MAAGADKQEIDTQYRDDKSAAPSAAKRLTLFSKASSRNEGNAERRGSGEVLDICSC